MDALEREIRRLVDSQALTAEQARGLRDAVRADQDVRHQPVDSPAKAGTGGPRSAVLEVLGYVGGALLVGAMIFLGFMVWDDLGEGGRNAVAVATVIISVGGGLLLLGGKVRPDPRGGSDPGPRRQLGQVLMAVGCCAIGFAWFIILADDRGVASATVVVIISVVGAVVLRGGAFLVSFASGGALLVAVAVLNRDTADWSNVAELLGTGYLLLAVALAAAGIVLARSLAWSLAGLVGWGSAWCWFAADHGEWLGLLAATLVAGVLLVAFVWGRHYAYAVIGCLVVLTLWPTCLYRIVDSALGVAIGLIAAGAVLIGVVAVLSRKPRKRPVIEVHRTSH